MKILVVDDDKYMLDLVGSILKKHDMDVVSRSNVGDAIRELAGGGFDCVLLDLHMPGMDAFSAIPVIKNISPSVDIGVMTGDTDPKWSVLAAQKGADFFLWKQFDAANILKFVERVSGKKQQ